MRAHPASVAEWYTAAARWDEQVTSIREQGVSDLSDRTWEASGKRVREMTWTCRHGRPGLLRFETEMGAEGVLLPMEQGFGVRRKQLTFTHRQFGRDLVVEIESDFEFRGFPDSSASLARLTEIVALHRQKVTGGPWWEQVLPPITARLHAEMRAKEAARRCESELADGSLVGRWPGPSRNDLTPPPFATTESASQSDKRSRVIEVLGFTVLVGLGVLTWVFDAREPIPVLFALGVVVNIGLNVWRTRRSS